MLYSKQSTLGLGMSYRPNALLDFFWSKARQPTPAGRIPPAKQFDPAHVLLCLFGSWPFLWLKFNNNPAEMLFPLVTAIESAVKCLMFGRRPFFWSTVMVVARWNLTRSGCGPRDEKIVEPCGRKPQEPGGEPKPCYGFLQDCTLRYAWCRNSPQGGSRLGFIQSN